MKKLLFLFSLLSVAGTAFSEEKITVDNLSIPQGRKAEMVVNFQFDEPHEYVSYQFTVDLPEGVTLVADEYGKAAYTLPDNQPTAIFNVDFLASNGIVKVYSSPSTNISGNSGVLIRIPVEASAELEIGSTLSGKLKDVEFTKNTGAVRTVFGDAEINITIAEPRLLFDENATRLPYYDDGETANIKMNRTLKKDLWNTLVLPFPVSKANLKTVFGEGAAFAQFDNDFEIEYEDDNITAHAITLKFKTVSTARAGLSAQKPYLVKPAQDITSFELDGVKLSKEPTPDTKQDIEGYSSGSFMGTFVKTQVPSDCVFLSNETFYYSTGATEIQAFRAWFDLQAIVGQEVNVVEARMLKFIVDDSDVTAIRGITDSPIYDLPIYDLSGRKIENSKSVNSKLPRGLYIRNGKKVIVK